MKIREQPKEQERGTPVLPQNKYQYNSYIRVGLPKFLLLIMGNLWFYLILFAL